MKKIKSSIFTLCALSVLSTACVKVETTLPFQGKKKSNSVSTTRNVNQEIGDEKITLGVISNDVFREMTLKNSILRMSAPEAQAALKKLPQGGQAVESIARQDAVKAQENLLVAIPMGLIGEQNIFGGVITKVSDKENELLGSLKLTDLSPIHVRTLVNRFPDGTPAITLVGCAFDCEETSQQGGLISFPVVGFDPQSQMLILDLAPIGRELDLISMLDPQGGYTQLKAIKSATTAVDYSVSTLVFDIKTTMIPVTADVSDASAPKTEFTVRWYLRLNSAFNPAFTSRAPTPGVGFFTTERSKSPKITRFSITRDGSSVHYYIKNVPEEYKGIFAGALDNWNKEFQKTIGHELLTYEFVDANDPRSAELVAGDIRYNIIEWDLVNRASYGGLGPSIANQFTGETLSANVLIQGPSIVKNYKQWFDISQQVRELKEQGLLAEANNLMKEFNVNVQKELKALSQAKFELKLGKQLVMTVHAQRPELEDPMVKNHFEIVPEGMTFEEYMEGYFTEMLEHELGHNFGLRHNFKGNLGSNESGRKGTVSRSVMEYLGRPHRHLNSIGLYDRMAIAYGYKGVAPKHLDWFCTDEDQGYNAQTMAQASAECTKSDATSDPFSFFEGRIERAIDLLVDLNSPHAPVWKLDEIKSNVDEALTGLYAYALSADKTAHTWTNFFGKADRPESPAEVKDYVLASVKSRLCSPEVREVIKAKESADAVELAEKNFVQLREYAAGKGKELSLFTATDFSCQ